MISQRRIRVLIVTTLAVFILYLHYSGESQSVQNQKFYQSTVAAINAEKANTGNAGAGHHPPNTNKEQPDEGYTYVDRGDDKQEPAIPKAQPEVQEQPKAPEDQDTEEIPIAGRTKMTVPKGKDQNNGRVGAEAEAEAEAENVPTRDKEDEQEKKKQQELEDEQAKVKAELNGILKRSPIIIFSKSYCPFSKKAKTILLEKYSIVPAPFVVELDQHPLGSQLQALLGENTGRQTVPNILVNGRSIGGGDDIVALDDHEELASRLKSLGSKWLQEVKLRETGSAD